MSVRRRAIQERRDRDGMRRAEYEQTKRWLGNVRELVRKKLMFDDQRISAEELAACFGDAERAADTSAACTGDEAGEVQEP